jgi:hypothetical protein
MKFHFLNVTTIGIGAFLICSGFKKLAGDSAGIELHVGDMLLSAPKNDSVFYAIVINLIGGLALCFHAISTYNFKKQIVDKFEEDLKVDSATAQQPANITKLAMTAGIISIILGIWFVIEIIVLMTGFESVSAGFYGFIIFLTLINVPFAIVPILLVGRNLALSSRLGQIVVNQEKSEIRARSIATRKTRR